MAKKDKKNNDKKVIKKTKNTKRVSYADNMASDVSPELVKFTWIIAIVFVIFIGTYVLSAIATGNPIFPTKETDEEELEFQFSEILVGQSFDKGDNYIVVYYDFSDEDDEKLNDLEQAYTEIKYAQPDIKVFTCDLGNSFNKQYVTSDEINYNPQSAEELHFNGTTVIKFNNGNVERVVTGTTESIDYINSLNPHNNEE